jgi:hypothetical protein
MTGDRLYILAWIFVASVAAGFILRELVDWLRGR